jgi:hypothetical protein
MKQFRCFKTKKKLEMFYNTVQSRADFITNKKGDLPMNIQRKFKILFSIFLAVTGLFALVQMPILGGLALGGVITQGILGGFRGKVGPVVGGKWKSIDYMRSYVIPANPNTTNQQNARAKFAALVSKARDLLTTLLQVYWDPFYNSMSGFNAWISQNYSLSDATGKMTINNLMAKGTLEPLAGSLLADPSLGTIAVTWDGTITGNGLATDTVLFVVYDNSSEDLVLVDPSETRASESATVDPGFTAEEDDIVYAFCTRGTGTELVVSDSLGVAALVP